MNEELQKVWDKLPDKVANTLETTRERWKSLNDVETKATDDVLRSIDRTVAKAYSYIDGLLDSGLINLAEWKLLFNWILD